MTGAHVRRRIAAALGVAGLALLVTACGDADDSAPASTGTFVAVDIDFEEAPSQLAAGEVTVELVNEGQLEHNVAFEELGGDPVVVAAGGETTTGTVTLDPGEYTAYCTVAGHRAAGMESTVTVEG